MKVITKLAILFAAMFIHPVFADENAWRFPTDRITTEQWQTYLDETLALPGVHSYEAAKQLIIEDPTNKAIYVFTTAAHPAHPAVVKRQVIQQGGMVSISRKGHYAGDQAAYDQWWHEFDALDKGVKNGVKK